MKITNLADANALPDGHLTTGAAVEENAAAGITYVAPEEGAPALFSAEALQRNFTSDGHFFAGANGHAVRSNKPIVRAPDES